MTFITDGNIWQFQLPGLSYDSGYTDIQHGVKYMQERRNMGWGEISGIKKEIVLMI